MPRSGPFPGSGAVRASLSLRTTVEDVERLVRALTDLTDRGPSWTYALADGHWTPRPDPRPLDPG